MSKFKQGDKVKILRGSNIQKYTGTWVRAMEEHVGKVLTIECIAQEYEDGRIGYFTEETGLMFDERGLELISEYQCEKIMKDEISIPIDKFLVIAPK